MVGMGSECELKTAWTVRAICPECGTHVELQRNTCGKIECPRCYRTWARRAAQRSAARVFGFFDAKGTHFKPRHIVFEVESLDWKAASARCLALGFSGGVLILHPFRIRERFRTMFEVMSARTGINRYDLVRQSDIGAEALEYAPHAHFVGYGKGVEVQKGGGEFKYRMLRKLPSLGAVERVMHYLLGHSLHPGYHKTGRARDAVKYFGVCATRNLAPSYQGTVHVPLECDECGARMLDADALERGLKEMIEVRKYFSSGWHVVHPKPKSSCAGNVPAWKL